eukprot:CAMPEP_0185695952 /NCGR_PEP_ID=MMETSP1164-20130828/4831_1 /TAXON_ID=1104430 /ORGANISM="Chrysoreinhardia sp, Strain CCMP2950" /LENGTH=602 /DNA_ID=CAMNT_0028362823 /DNA_START=77 /DNA_END=1885 /DNA_ORIENTATION=+
MATVTPTNAKYEAAAQRSGAPPAKAAASMMTAEKSTASLDDLGKKLGEPLPFIKVDSEQDLYALEAYRQDYASYRLGAMKGAKGERPPSEAKIYADLATANKALTDALAKVSELQQTTRDLEAIRAAYATRDENLDGRQREARSHLRDALYKRQDAKLRRVETAMRDVLGKAAKGHIEASTYHFTTGAPVKTDVLVARGVVKAPEHAAFEIIPKTAASSPIFVFTDETVNGLYGERFVDGFRRLGYDVTKIVVPDGEDAKTLDVFAELADKVLSIGIDKHSILISLGGGAVANVCGFIASTLHRGIGLIHFPTTLLAQCDASISHKQAVNAPHGKNLVGSYYAPLKIVVDPDVLVTLDDWLLPDGFGEIVKHALCQDTDVLLKMLDDHDGDLLDLDFLERAVRRTIELKCEVIDVDPKEKREAVVLIYGHELAHAIETVSHRPGSLCCLSHGQAVAIGCVVSARVSVALGCCDSSVVQRTIDLCEKYHLPTTVPPDQSIDAIMRALRKTKVYTTEGCQFALLERVGRLFNVDGEYHLPVDDAIIREATEATMAAPGTVILGAGSSGFLRRNKKPSRADLVEAADKNEPGAGWTLEGNAPHAC